VGNDEIREKELWDLLLLNDMERLLSAPKRDRGGHRDDSQGADYRTWRTLENNTERQHCSPHPNDCKTEYLVRKATYSQYAVHNRDTNRYPWWEVLCTFDELLVELIIDPQSTSEQCLASCDLVND